MSDPIRVVVFGSYYRGLNILKALETMKGDGIEIVGIATDDPAQSFVSPHRRVWQYGYTPKEKDMVRVWAIRNDIPLWDGKVKEDRFHDLYFNDWMPDLCLMGTFGQKIPPVLFEYPCFGFYNFHPCVKRAWPSYVGGNPFQAMMDAHEPLGVICMHEVNEEWDNGVRIAVTEEFPIFENDTVPDLHRRSASLVQPVVRQAVRNFLSQRLKPDVTDTFSAPSLLF